MQSPIKELLTTAQAAPVPYKQYMQRESRAEKMLATEWAIIGMVLCPGWMRRNILAGNPTKEHVAQYQTFADLRREAFAASQTIIDLVVANSGFQAINRLPPDIRSEQLLHMQKLRNAGRLVIKVVADDALRVAGLEPGTHISTFVDSDPTLCGTYVEYDPPNKLHEEWYPFESAGDIELQAIHTFARIG